MSATPQERCRQSYLKNRERVLARSKANYQKNKEKRTAQIAAWQLANPESVRASQKRYLSKNPDKRRLLWKNWYAKNGDAYRAYKSADNKAKYPARRERQKAWWKKYYRENKARLSLRVLKRKALQKKASINLAGITEFITSVRKSPSVRCYYCGCRMSGKTCHFDHIVALANGGSHSADNLCVSCPPCNLSKQDKPLNIWIKVGQQLLSL